MHRFEKEYMAQYGSYPTDDNERLGYVLVDRKIPNMIETLKEEINRIRSIKWKVREFTFYILPKATPRPRATSINGHYSFYVKGAKDHKQFFKSYTKNEDIEIIKTPTKFHSEVYVPTPSGMNAVERVLAELGYIRPTSKPDWDNFAKTYCDMIQGLLIDDDSLIIEGSLKKYYSIKPRIHIKLEYMEDFDCGFNRKKSIRKDEQKDGESDLC